MKVLIACVAMKFAKNPFLPFAVLAITFLMSGVAYADVQQDVSRLFELHAKLTPGMTIEAFNEILGPAVESHALGGNAKHVTRHVWLHGEMGVEVYEMEGAAYRVAITLPCGSNKDQLRALDALTRQGHSRYGSMPRSDPTRNEYYWEMDGIRFAYSRYNQTTVLSSSTKVH